MNARIDAVAQRESARLPVRNPRSGAYDTHVEVASAEDVAAAASRHTLAEIEAALEHHPDVLEAAVFGIPSEEWGENVHAVVVCREGGSLTEDQVRDFARDHLANYKVPKSVTFLDELPKTGSGKILKRELRAPFWAGRTSKV